MRRPRRVSWRYGSLSLLGALLAIALPAPAGVETCNVTAEPPGPVAPGAWVDFKSGCTGAPLGTVWYWDPVISCDARDGPETTCNFPYPGFAFVTAQAAYADGYGGCHLVSDYYLMQVNTGAPPTCTIRAVPRSPVQPGAWAELTAGCTGSPTSYAWTSCLADCSTLVGASTECHFPTTGTYPLSVRASYGGCFEVADGFTMAVGFSAPPSCHVRASPAGPVQPGAWAEVQAECTATPSWISWSSSMASCSPASGPVVSCAFPSEPWGYVSATAAFTGGQYAGDWLRMDVSRFAPPTCAIKATPPGPVDPGGTATMDARCVGSPTAIDWSSSLANCTPPTGPTTVCTFPNIGTSAVRVSATYPYGAGSSLVAIDEYPMNVSGASCNYAVAPLDLSNVPAAGGPQTVTVTTPSGCPVTAQSFQPWVTVAAIEPNGATTNVRLAFAPNTGPPRATSVVLAGRLYLVTQLGP